MKTIFVLCGLILVAGGLYAWHTTRTPDVYGTFSGAPAVPVADLIAAPTSYLHKTVSIEGIVTEQCAAMGCYFFVPSGTSKLRVDLEEIAMSAPRKEGHPARIEGQIVPYGDGYQLLASAVEFK